MKQRKKALVVSIYDDDYVLYRIDGADYRTSVPRLKTLEPYLTEKIIQASKILGVTKIKPEEADKLIAISFEKLPKQDSELSSYEMHIKQIKKLASNENFPRPSVNTPQNILWIKDVGCEIIENEFDDERVYTFRDGDKFGFSEYYVNKLMEIAYLFGRKENEDILNEYKVSLKEFLMRAFEDMLNETL